MAVAWTVTGSLSTTDIVGDRLVPMTEILYEIVDPAYRGSVKIPTARVNPDTVREAINADAANHAAILRLDGFSD